MLNQYMDEKLLSESYDSKPHDFDMITGFFLGISFVERIGA